MRSRWVGWVGSVLCLAGLGDAAYLTYEHFTSSSSLVCSDHGIVNCLKVTTSGYSRVAGIPVSVLGLIFFAVMLVAQLPPLWANPRREILAGRLLWSLVGMGSVIWLLYAELFGIDAICLWCTGVHVITFLVFIVTVIGTMSALDGYASRAWDDEPEPA